MLTPIMIVLALIALALAAAHLMDARRPPDDTVEDEDDDDRTEFAANFDIRPSIIYGPLRDGTEL